MDSPFDKFLGILESWSTKGERRLASGAWLICPTPHVAPEAWLHVVFPPLSDNDIRDLEKQCGSVLPTDFREFLLRANGVSIFSSRIKVWGLRRSYARTGDEAWQPFDLPSHNEKYERPLGSPDTVLYFGSDDNGAARCFFEPKGDSCRVGKTSRERFHPIQYWSDFWDWLLNETQRLASHYRDS